MTVTSKISRKIYVSDGMQLDFPITFPHANQHDIRVVVASYGVELDGYEWTVIDEIDEKVSFTQAPPAETEIIIWRDTSPLQHQSWSDGVYTSQEAIEYGFDQQAMVNIDQAGHAGRAIRLPDHEAAIDPLPGNRADSYLIFDEDGTPQVAPRPESSIREEFNKLLVALTSRVAELEAALQRTLRLAHDVPAIEGVFKGAVLGFSDTGLPQLIDFYKINPVMWPILPAPELEDVAPWTMDPAPLWEPCDPIRMSPVAATRFYTSVMECA